MAHPPSQAAPHSSTVGVTSQPSDHNSIIDESPDVKWFSSFDDMPLHPLLLRGIYSYGFEIPCAIQQRAIVPLINKGDVLAQAPSGTGKTAAFSIGTLARLDFRQKALQALILSPTRELAVQIHEVLSRIGDYLAESNPYFCQTFVGGTRVQDDTKKIQSGAIVAVGTAGRVLDLMKRGAFHTDMMKMMVLDAADEMLSQGFQEQIYEIFRFMPRDIQVCLFTTTMTRDVLELAQQFMRDPTRILVRQKSLTLDSIKQFYVAVEEDHKLETLMDLYESVSIAQSVVFVNTIRKAEYVTSRLSEANLSVCSLHSDMPQDEREKTAQRFSDGHVRVLVTTDLVARGINVDQANFVVNFDLPTNMENYIRRIGRCGRFGRKRVAINFVSQRDDEMHKGIAQHYHTVIGELPLNFPSVLAE